MTGNGGALGAPTGSAATAVVLGAGMAGLLAARALADHFARVVVLESDHPDETGDARKGVPQGEHTHALLKSGEIILERFFPGIVEELVRAGSIRVDFGADFSWQHHGHWKLRFDSGLVMLLQSRPFLEAHVRRRLAQIGRVTRIDNAAAKGLLTDRSGARVTGVRYSTSDGEPVELRAALTVDATGRGSRCARWLEALGVPAPGADSVALNLRYATRCFRRGPEGRPRRAALMVHPKPPHQRRAGIVLPIEGDRWIVTLAGYHDDHPPADPEGWLAFTQGLASDAVSRFVRGCEGPGAIRTYAFAAQVRRRFDPDGPLPEGFLVIGDAVCSLDPLFGQGMSVAAKQAQALARSLCEVRLSDGGTSEQLRSLARVYFRRVERAIDPAWTLARGEALRYAGSGLTHTPLERVVEWYLDEVFRLSASHETVYRRFVEVSHLLSPLSAIFAPPVLVPVLVSGLSRALGGPRPLRRPVSPAKSGSGGHP